MNRDNYLLLFILLLSILCTVGSYSVGYYVTEYTDCGDVLTMRSYCSNISDYVGLCYADISGCSDCLGQVVYDEGSGSFHLDFNSSEVYGFDE